MWQRHSLYLGNGTRVPQSYWKATPTAPVFQLIAHHVHGQLLSQAGLDHKAFAAFIVIYHSGGHSIHEAMFFINILGQEHPHVLVDLGRCSSQLAFLQLVLRVVVFQVGFIVEKGLAKRPLISMAISLALAQAARLHVSTVVSGCLRNNSKIS